MLGGGKKGNKTALLFFFLIQKLKSSWSSMHKTPLSTTKKNWQLFDPYELHLGWASAGTFPASVLCCEKSELSRASCPKAPAQSSPVHLGNIPAEMETEPVEHNPQFPSLRRPNQEWWAFSFTKNVCLECSESHKKHNPLCHLGKSGETGFLSQGQLDWAGKLHFCSLHVWQKAKSHTDNLYR